MSTTDQMIQRNDDGESLCKRTKYDKNDDVCIDFKSWMYCRDGKFCCKDLDKFVYIKNCSKFV